MITETIKHFIDNSYWKFAKSMPQWPHEYVVRSTLNEKDFLEFVQFIRSNGYSKRFNNRVYIYYDYNGHSYWTMGSPLEKTIIINRCKIVEDVNKKEIIIENRNEGQRDLFGSVKIRRG